MNAPGSQGLRRRYFRCQCGFGRVSPRHRQTCFVQSDLITKQRSGIKWIAGSAQSVVDVIFGAAPWAHRMRVSPTFD